MTLNAALEAGGVLAGNKVEIALEIKAVKQGERRRRGGDRCP